MKKTNYKYSIGYLYDYYEIKQLHIILPKTRAYVNSYDGQTNWMYFLAADDNLLENIILLGIKSALILRTNLLANILAIKNLCKPK